jgi:LmbE family N-acetylglucosaminyl deacetylase
MAAPLFGEAPGRALAVYAHPDDPEISCGATLAGWAAGGT